MASKIKEMREWISRRRLHKGFHFDIEEHAEKLSALLDEAEAYMEWIDPETRLPDKDPEFPYTSKTVIIWFDDVDMTRRVTEAYYSYDEEKWMNIQIVRFNRFKIRGWRYRPEAPEGE